MSRTKGGNRCCPHQPSYHIFLGCPRRARRNHHYIGCRPPSTLFASRRRMRLHWCISHPRSCLDRRRKPLLQYMAFVPPYFPAGRSCIREWWLLCLALCRRSYRSHTALCHIQASLSWPRLPVCSVRRRHCSCHARSCSHQSRRTNSEPRLRAVQCSGHCCAALHTQPGTQVSRGTGQTSRWKGGGTHKDFRPQGTLLRNCGCCCVPTHTCPRSSEPPRRVQHPSSAAAYPWRCRVPTARHGARCASQGAPAAARS